MKLVFFPIFLLCVCNVKCGGKAPNIVLILADDLGTYDLSYHGSNQFTTPNIDALGYNGVILNKHYTQAICTPSRAALLTGKYPMRLGMQGTPLSAGENRHLPISAQTLPQHLKKLGYKTHLVGKWHLGAAKREETPLKRGFDSHFGYWNGYIGYYSYRVNSTLLNETEFNGFDLKENFTDAWKYQGKNYATELFTEKALSVIENHNEEVPLFLMVAHVAVHTGDEKKVEVKDEEEMNQSFGYIEDLERRRYVDALVKLDESVGRIVDKLAKKKILDNSVVVFLSDNGAQRVGLYHNGGNNYPLRGEKQSLHEGGNRNAAVLYSPLLKKFNYVHNEMLHITDWLPTFYSLAGGDLKDLGTIDGIGQWKSVSENSKSSRKEVLINIDEAVSCSALIAGRYKLINGTCYEGVYDGYSEKPENYKVNYNISAILESLVNKAIDGSSGKSRELDEALVAELRKEAELPNSRKTNTRSSSSDSEVCSNFCLFDLEADPSEYHNLIEDSSKIEIINEMKGRLSKFWGELVPQTNQPVDVKSDPKRFNGTWCTWLDDEFCVKTPTMEN